MSSKEKMQKALDYLTESYSEIRAGRANPHILNHIKVDYYGTPTAINGMAAISVQDARTLVISPWDASTLKLIEKELQTSDLGINPQNDGKVIRLNFPPLTEERRRDIVKDIKKHAEEAKVQVRNARRDAIDALKKSQKAGEITEDDLKGAEKDEQNATDKYCKLIDEAAAAKEKEILEI